MTKIWDVLFALLISSNTLLADFGDKLKESKTSDLVDHLIQEESKTSDLVDHLIQEESRHHEHTTRKQFLAKTEIPITFQAPPVNAPDYWKDSPRRTFFDYGAQNILTFPFTKGVKTFYNMMNEFLGIDNAPANNHIPKNPQYPFKQSSYNQQRFPNQIYIPSPKPIRASIVKLEPVVNYESLDFPKTSTQHYPQFVKILNDVILENSLKHQQYLGSNQQAVVLEKPQNEIKPTTYKPKSAIFRFRTTTPKILATIYPVSIQDQLPPISGNQNIKIPYEPEIPDIVLAQPTVAPRSKILFPSTTTEKEATQQSTLELSETLKSVNVLATTAVTPTTTTTSTTTATSTSTSSSSSTATTITTPTTTTAAIAAETEPANNDSGSGTTEEILTIAETPSDFNVTTETNLEPQPSNNHNMITPILHTMETTEYNRFIGAFPKKLHSRRVTTETPSETTVTVQHVTDLTLLGLSKQSNLGASLPNSSITERAWSSVIEPRSTYVAHLDDELSLDAKILRDTNWDGLSDNVTNQTTSPPTTKPTALLEHNTTETNETKIIESRITQSVSRQVSNEIKEKIDIDLLMAAKTQPTPRRGGRKLPYYQRARNKTLSFGKLNRRNFPTRAAPKTKLTLATSDER